MGAPNSIYNDQLGAHFATKMIFVHVGPKKMALPATFRAEPSDQKMFAVLGPLCWELYAWNISRFVLFKILGALGT